MKHNTGDQVLHLKCFCFTTHWCLGCSGTFFCCNYFNQCSEGEGDCNFNLDCRPGLYCGSNNCVGDSFDPTDDCCVRKKCTGKEGCCTEKNKCGEGEGDCGSDEDCQNGLVCGKNNCKGKTFDKTDDCCVKPGNTL